MRLTSAGVMEPDLSGCIGSGGMASVYGISVDSDNPQRFVADKNGQYAHKVIEIIKQGITQVNEENTFGLINFESDKNKVTIEKSDFCLNEHDNDILKRSLYEGEVLSVLNGNRNTVDYLGSEFVLAPGEFSTKSGEMGRTLYNVLKMNKVSGENLRYAKKFLSPRMASLTIAHVAEALHDAHEKGVIHRDVTPANVMVNPLYDDITTTLIDFGASTFADYNIDKENSVIGTAKYFSPEHVHQNIVYGMDIFSLGLLAFEVFTLQMVFPEIKDPIECAIKMLKYKNDKGRGEIMDNLKKLSKNRGIELPSELLEAIEVALDDDHNKRSLTLLHKEALKFATGIQETEELPNILQERDNVSFDKFYKQNSEEKPSEHAPSDTYIHTTDFMKDLEHLDL